MEARDAEAACALLARSTIFARCRADDLSALAAQGRFMRFDAHQDIVLEGELALELMIIESGLASVVKRGAGGGQHELNRLRPGDSFGEMALFDDVERSASVHALEPVRALVIPVAAVLALAESRPSFVQALVGIARVLTDRLRLASNTAVAAAERALEEERMRSAMGQFTLLLILAYSLYTWVLGTVTEVKQALGRSELVTVPVILVCVAILFVFMKTSGYPPRFFGITLKNARRDIQEALLLTLPWLALTVALKVWLVAEVPVMHGEPVFQMFASATPEMQASRFNPWLALAYIVFAPFQELIYRGGLQGALAHFLTGRWRVWLAILGSNTIFSAAHLYVSPALGVTAFVAGIFWGWLYARQRGLAGVSVSHLLLGFWAFEVVDLGVLE